MPSCLLLMLHLGVAVASTRWPVSTDCTLTSSKFFDQKSAVVWINYDGVATRRPMFSDLCGSKVRFCVRADEAA